MEFILIAMVLFVFIFFMADLVLRQATLGKLDRVSYSVAGVLRERIQLYDAREELNQQDVDQSLALAKRVLKDMNSTADLSAMGIAVEEIHFEDPRDLSDTSKTVKMSHTWHSGAAQGCQAPQPLNNLQQLSPRGSYGRWVPLYQVTLCIPTISWYTRLTSGLDMQPVMSSFSVVILR